MRTAAAAAGAAAGALALGAAAVLLKAYVWNTVPPAGTMAGLVVAVLVSLVFRTGGLSSHGFEVA